MNILPDAVWASLFSGWLTVVEISRLDSAFCNYHQRKLFTASAYHTYPGLRYPVVLPEEGVAGTMMEWIYRKKAPMRGLRLKPSQIVDRQLLLQYLTICGRRLEWVILKEDIAVSNDDSGSFVALCFEKHCPNLRKLSATNCHWDTMVMNIVKSGRSLVDLYVKGTITSENIQELVGACKSLKKLIISTASVVQEPVLIALVANCPNLEYVDFRRCGSFTDAMLDALTVACPNLMSVSLSRASLTSPVLFAWLECATNLRYLYLSVSTVASITATKTQCAVSLAELNLSNVNMAMHDLRAILSHSPNLEKLNLHHCTSLNTVFHNISGLFHLCPQLKFLNGTSKKAFQLLPAASVPLF
jgi:hypothetical protein